MLGCCIDVLHLGLCAWPPSVCKRINVCTCVAGTGRVSVCVMEAVLLDAGEEQQRDAFCDMFPFTTKAHLGVKEFFTSPDLWLRWDRLG
jgi:hypothetical protein